MGNFIIFGVGLFVSLMVFAGLFYSVTGQMQKQAASSRITNQQLKDDHAEYIAAQNRDI